MEWDPTQGCVGWILFCVFEKSLEIADFLVLIS